MIVVILTNTGFGIITEQPTLGTETLGLIHIPIECNATIITTATTDRGYDKNLARAIMSCSFKINVSELTTCVRVTTLAIPRILVSGITALKMQSYIFRN